MIGIIIALSVVCIFLILMLVSYQNIYKEVFTEYVNDFCDNIYPCKLILTINFNQPQESSITDFSQYDKNGIIGLTINYMRETANIKEKAINGTPELYTPAVVYKLGEQWLWKLR